MITSTYLQIFGLDTARTSLSKFGLGVVNIYAMRNSNLSTAAPIVMDDSRPPMVVNRLDLLAQCRVRLDATCGHRYSAGSISAVAASADRATGRRLRSAELAPE